MLTGSSQNGVQSGGRPCLVETASCQKLKKYLERTRINPRENWGPDGQIGFALGAAEGIQKIYERVVAL
jgi:hypothetical protein